MAIVTQKRRPNFNQMVKTQDLPRTKNCQIAILVFKKIIFQGLYLRQQRSRTGFIQFCRSEVRKLDFKVQVHRQLDVPPPYWRPPGLYRLTLSKVQVTSSLEFESPDHQHIKENKISLQIIIIRLSFLQFQRCYTYIHLSLLYIQ